jgi:hypothetical protein
LVGPQAVRPPPTQQEIRITARGESSGQKNLLRIAMVFLPFDVLDALQPDQFDLGAARSGYDALSFRHGETMQGAGAVLVMIWTPILTLGFTRWPSAWAGAPRLCGA